MKKPTNIPTLALPVLALVASAGMLLFFESDFLWKLQEESLFLNTAAFFREQMVEPGGLLSWLGAWCTQFFFYPWVGTLILCAWWLLLMWLIQRTFRVSRSWMAVVIIPVLFLLVTIVDTGYWVYVLKLRGHAFVATIGTTAAVALLWAFRFFTHKISLSRRSRFFTLHFSLFTFFACAVGFPLFGIYGIGATLLMAVWIWRLEPRRFRALAVSLTGLLSAVMVPLFYYRFVYYQTNVANLYYAKLPLYYIKEEYFSYYTPYILLLLFFLVMTLLCPSPEPVAPSPKPERPSPKRAQRHFSFPVSYLSFVFLACAIVYTAFSWYSDENFHHEVAMQRCIDRLDWEGVLKEAAKQDDEPTRAVVMMRNLALARLGRQGDEMFRYKNGCKQCDAPFDIRALNTVGIIIYYHYGMPNYSYRLCMESGVEFGWRAGLLKYLARCSTLDWEWSLARKYLGVLRQTLFHDTWAETFGQLVGHPEQFPKSDEMGFIIQMKHFSDALASDHGLLEDFLMKKLMSTNYTGNPLFVEQAIYASLWAKNTKEFWRALYNYARLYPDRPWPVHVQEAAILFGTLEHKKMMDQWPITPAVRESYRSFTQMASLYDGSDWETVNKALYPAFGHTYFYDVYMINFPSQN